MCPLGFRQRIAEKSPSSWPGNAPDSTLYFLSPSSLLIFSAVFNCLCPCAILMTELFGHLVCYRLFKRNRSPPSYICTNWKEGSTMRTWEDLKVSLTLTPLGRKRKNMTFHPSCGLNGFLLTHASSFIFTYVPQVLQIPVIFPDNC
jgi:hypothetical protein